MTGERDNIREQLSAYLDGELGAAQQRQVEAALETDEQLRTELEQLRRVRDMVGSLPVAEAPEGFVERVVARAERDRLMADDGQTAVGGGSAVRWARMLATAAVLMVAAGAGFTLVYLLISPGTEQQVADAPEPIGEIARDRQPAPVTAPEVPSPEAEELAEEPSPEAEELPDEPVPDHDDRMAARSREEAAPEAPQPAGPQPPAPEKARPGVRARLESEQYVDHAPGYAARRPGRPTEDAPEAAAIDRLALAGAEDLQQRVLAEAHELVLYTADLAVANEAVIRVLNEKGIVVEPPADHERAAPVQWASNFNRPRSAFASILADEQLQIVVFVPDDDLPELLQRLQQVTLAKRGTLLDRVDAPEAPDVVGLAEAAEAAPDLERYEDEPQPEERAEQDADRTRHMLRRQLHEQVARRPPEEPETEEPTTDTYDVPARQRRRRIAEADLRPVLINVFELRAATETMREQPDTDAEEPEAEEPQQTD